MTSPDTVSGTHTRSNLLLWNQAGTGFVEGASLAGADAYGWHTGVAAGDIDGNGFVDLVVAGYADLNRARPNASTAWAFHSSTSTATSTSIYSSPTTRNRTVYTSTSLPTGDKIGCFATSARPVERTIAGAAWESQLGT